MLIGITGTDGAGKGEKVFTHFRKRLPSIFGENGDNLYSVCKTPAPVMIRINNNNITLC